MQSAFFSSFEIATSPLLDCCCRLAVSCILGMLIGIELAPDFPAGALMRRLLARGFVPGTASGNVLRLAPPLIISKDEMDAFVAALAEELK